MTDQTTPVHLRERAILARLPTEMHAEAMWWLRHPDPEARDLLPRISALSREALSALQRELEGLRGAREGEDAPVASSVIVDLAAYRERR